MKILTSFTPDPSAQPTPPELQKLNLFAWVGESEFAEQKPGLGIKQIQSPCGDVVAAAMTELDPLKTPGIVQAFNAQVYIYKKPVYLCRFIFAEHLGGISPATFKKR